jgi:serine/threonine protein kinase
MDNNMNMQGLYALEDRILGKGSFGVVYLGVDLANDRYVSLKKIPPEIKEDHQKINALSNEILISAGVDNINLVKILDLTDIGTDKYIVYEFCNGGDLRRYLRYFKRFDERAVQYFMMQVLNGLKELHEKKIIHHDLKPENVLVELIPFVVKDNKNIEEKKKFEKDVDNILQLTDKKRYQNQFNISNSYNMNKDKEKEIVYNTLLKSKIKVSDFGLSKFKEDNNEKMLGGSPLYMDPNLFEPNVEIKTIENEKVDIWAIGIFAYELFFGKRPFNSPSQSLKELIQILKIGVYYIDLKECGKVSKQFLSFLNMCLQRPQKIRPNVQELLFSEFITRDPNNFEYITLDNVYTIKFPGASYYNENADKIITMNIDDQRSINANFDF